MHEAICTLIFDGLIASMPVMRACRRWPIRRRHRLQGSDDITALASMMIAGKRNAARSGYFENVDSGYLIKTWRARFPAHEQPSFSPRHFQQLARFGASAPSPRTVITHDSDFGLPMAPTPSSRAGTARAHISPIFAFSSTAITGHGFRQAGARELPAHVIISRLQAYSPQIAVGVKKSAILLRQARPLCRHTRFHAE